MKPRALLITLALLVLACGGTSRPTGPDADRAFDELLRYHGNGAFAARRVIEWVDEIVAGGPEMLDRISEALETAPDRKYAVGTWRADHSRGIFSCLPTLRAALAEAASRIGGDDAIGILIREANRPGTWPEAWIDRYAAFAYLKPHADREEVREYFGRRIGGLLRSRKDDPEARVLLQIARHDLPADVWDVVAAAFTTGWAERSTADELAATLVSLDEDRAGRLFLAVVVDPAAPGGSRTAAARALGRLPGARPEAVTRILALGEGERALVGWFVEGMRHGRFEEDQMESAARESLDLDRMLTYIRVRLADLAEQMGHLDTLQAAVGPDVARELRFEGWRQEFGKVIAFGEARQKQLIAEKERRESR